MGKKTKPSAPAAPTHENSTDTPMFRALVKAYEEKQYKKGLKLAEQLLTTHPDSGETMAMKGLIISNLGKDRQAEAYELVRQGLKLNLNSHTCWHVYGLLYRADLNYDEAIKCYKRALKLDKDNFQILRDLANLQIQRRDIAGFRDTCYKILQLRPKLRHSWIAYAVAHDLLGEPDAAVKVLHNYKETLEKVQEPNYEHGEMLLYNNELMEQCKDASLAEILKDLEANANLILDKMALRERRAHLLTALNQWDKANEAYLDLIGHNCDCFAYFQQLADLRRARHRHENPGSPELDQQEVSLALFAEMKEKFPDSMAARRVPLDVATGAKFTLLLSEYIRSFFEAGIPSLYSDLKSILSNPEKVSAIGEVLEQFETSLRKTGKFPDREEEAPAHALFWVLHTRSQHLSRVGRHDEALALVEEAIKLDETVLEPYISKARILKHMGDFAGAAAALEHARSIDQADRWYNSKTSLYRLRCNQVDEAEKIIDKFARQKDESKNNLLDMQCVWWATEVALAHARLNDTGRAFKYFHLVHKHFRDFQEDQFEFHSYCIRKMTLRSYLKLLAFEDSIYSHPFFVKAALGAVKTYLHHVLAPKTDAQADGEGDLNAMTDKERKKAISKQRREQARKEEEAKKAAAATPAPAAAGKKEKAKEDDDPNGDKYLSVEDPLKVACETFLSPLNSFGTKWLETHSLSIEVYLHRKKYLLALRAVKRGIQLMTETPVSLPREKRLPLHARASLVAGVQSFWLKYAAERDTLPAHVTKLIDEERATAALSAEGIAKFVQTELANHPQSLLHHIAEFEVLASTDVNAANTKLTAFLQSPELGKCLRWSPVLDANEAIRIVKGRFPGSVQQLKQAAAQAWPRSALFL